MGMGYEGWVRIGGVYALGTGGSVPQNVVKLESSSGYGGQISSPVPEIGIGSPRLYDWPIYDGSVDFEATEGVIDAPVGVVELLKSWVFDRQNPMEIFVRTRQANEQIGAGYWNSISLTTSQASLVTGSVGFVCLDREYVFGDFAQTKEGDGIFKKIGTPIAYWQTQVSWGDFTTWTLDYSQDVVKFFGCEWSPVPVAPKFLAVGPMSIAFSGDYLGIAGVFDAGDGTGLSLTVSVGETDFEFKKVEVQSESDNLQDPNSVVYVSIEAHPYEMIE